MLPSHDLRIQTAIPTQIGPMPSMLGDIIEQVLATLPSLMLVGRSAADSGDTLGDARRAGARLVLVAHHDPALASLAALDGLALFALAEDGQDGALLSLRRVRLPLDEAGLARLRRHLRPVLPTTGGR
jgi:hypothetical protein